MRNIKSLGLDYTDNITLHSNEASNFQRMIYQLDKISKGLGLNQNTYETKILKYWASG